MAIAQDLYIAISAARLGPNESLVLAMILEQLYGRRKLRTATLSAAEVGRKIGMSRSHVHRAKKGLLDRGMISESDDGIRFIKDYESWTRDGRPVLSPLALALIQSYAAIPPGKPAPDNPEALPPTVTPVTTNGNASEDGALPPTVTNVTTSGNARYHQRQQMLPPVVTSAPAPNRSARQKTDSRRLDDDGGNPGAPAHDHAREAEPPVPEPAPPPPDASTPLDELTRWFRSILPPTGDIEDVERSLRIWIASHDVDAIRDAVELAFATKQSQFKAYINATLRHWKTDPSRRIGERLNRDAGAAPKNHITRRNEAISEMLRREFGPGKESADG